MILFSVPGSSLSKKRAWFLTQPFDLAFQTPAVPLFTAGGILILIPERVRDVRFQVAAVERSVNDSYPYTFDYSRWELLASAEQIVSASLASDPAGLTITAPAINTDGNKVQVRFEAGEDGQTYRVTCDAVTTSGFLITGYVDVSVVDLSAES